MDKKIFVGGLTAAVLAASSAWAISETRQAQVTLVSPLSLNLGTAVDLNFGQVETPGAGVTETVIVATDGTTIGSTATITNSAAITQGLYQITGDATETVGISVTGSSLNGLTLGNFDLTYDGATFTSGATGLPAPTSSGAELAIGGTLSIDGDTVTPGAKTVAYTIEVNYQ